MTDLALSKLKSHQEYDASELSCTMVTRELGNVTPPVRPKNTF